MPNKPLRFAALIRVSSEKQERRGESLQTQSSQIQQAVDALGGKITARYAGQEHATPGWEREQLDMLLRDASKPRKKFDAIMVADPSRWSRDNARSEAGLDVLRDNGILFFAMLQPYDLFQPNDRAILGLTTTMNGWQAALLAQKSVLNRIAKLKKGELAVGSLPFGRTYDKGSRKWGLDETKAEMIQAIAERYIAGESLYDLAPEYGIGRELLRRTLMDRSGPEWEVSFSSDRFNIHESVMLKIPPLLDAKTINAVKGTAQANKTYKHGQIKNQYLLGRMVFCGGCNRAMRGATTKGHRYYQHTHDIPNCLKGGVRADELEDIVIRQLFDTFGNPEAVTRAIEEATPDAAKIEETRKRADRIIKELTKIDMGRERIIAFIGRGSITDTQAEKQLSELNQREDRLRDELDRLGQHLDKVPTADTIAAIAQQVAKRFRKTVSARKQAIMSEINHDFDAMTWEDKRALAETVLAGKLPDGRRMGIYIEPVPGEDRKQRRRWNYRILGQLFDADGYFPLPPSMHKAYFDGDREEVIPITRRSNTPR